MKDNIENRLFVCEYLADIVAKEHMPHIRIHPVCGEPESARNKDRAREMERLGRDKHRGDAEDVSRAVHTAIGIESGVVEEDILIGNALHQQIKTDRIHFVVAHGAVVAGDKNLRDLPRFVHLDSPVRSVYKNGREGAVLKERRSRDEGDLRARSVTHAVVYICSRPLIDGDMRDENESEEYLATECEEEGGVSCSNGPHLLIAGTDQILLDALQEHRICRDNNRRDAHQERRELGAEHNTEARVQDAAGNRYREDVVD